MCSKRVLRATGGVIHILGLLANWGEITHTGGGHIDMICHICALAGGYMREKRFAFNRLRYSQMVLTARGGGDYYVNPQGLCYNVPEWQL